MYVDYVRVYQKGAPVSIQIEAENWATMSGVQTEACSEGGSDVGWIDANDWIVWNVNVPTAGTYTVSYRVASLNGGGVIQLEKAGGSPVYGSVSVPKTGGWQTWTTVSHQVTLARGPAADRGQGAGRGLQHQLAQADALSAGRIGKGRAPGRGPVFSFRREQAPCAAPAIRRATARRCCSTPATAGTSPESCTQGCFVDVKMWMSGGKRVGIVERADADEAQLAGRRSGSTARRGRSGSARCAGPGRCWTACRRARPRPPAARRDRSRSAR